MSERISDERLEEMIRQGELGNSRSFVEHVSALRELQTLRTALSERDQLVREMADYIHEFTPDGNGFTSTCWTCGGMPERGHKEGCERKKLLDSVQSILKGE